MSLFHISVLKDFTNKLLLSVQKAMYTIGHDLQKRGILVTTCQMPISLVANQLFADSVKPFN